MTSFSVQRISNSFYQLRQRLSPAANLYIYLTVNEWIGLHLPEMEQHEEAILCLDPHPKGKVRIVPAGNDELWFQFRKFLFFRTSIVLSRSTFRVAGLPVNQAVRMNLHLQTIRTEYTPQILCPRL